MTNRYTYRKYRGDDIYSYALFDNGRPIMTGLSRDAARYEAEQRNPGQEVYATRYNTVKGRPVYKLSSKPGVTNWSETVYGYATGERGAWKVYDSSFWGAASVDSHLIGTAATLREAGALALAAHAARGKAPAPSGGRETSRTRWIRRTRESVARALRLGPGNAHDLEHNLDIDRWGRLPRSTREISAALRWLVEQGYAETDPAEVRPRCWNLTRLGFEFANNTTKEN